jgi:hypothetical protein
MRSHTATILALCMAASGASALSGQAPATTTTESRATDVRLYMHAVAREHGVPGRELEVLGAWVDHPVELPVLLFIANKAGVTPDVLGSLRDSGQSWQRIALRFGLGPSAFRVPIAVPVVDGVLARPVREFSRPVGEWHRIAMTDLEIIALVNLRTLSSQLGTTPEELIPEIDGISPDFIGAYARVVRARSKAEPPPS